VRCPVTLSWPRSGTATPRGGAASSRPGGSAARAAGFFPATPRGGAAFSRPGGSAARAAGFTLIEVIVAFALLALALTVLLGTMANASRQVRWSADAGRAAMHAQSLLAQVGVGEALVPGVREGEFEDGRYRWRLQVAPWQDPEASPSPLTDLAAPQMQELELSMHWGDGPGEHLRLRSLRLVRPDPTGEVPLP
jgi:general secretion pathway protein I